METMPAPAKKLSLKQRLWRKAKRVTRSAIIIYLLVCLVMYLLQTKLIFPGASLQGTADAQATAGKGEELVDLKTPTGTPLKALFCGAKRPQSAVKTSANPSISGLLAQNTMNLELPAVEATSSDTQKRPAVLYFYGNGECLAFCGDQADMFRRMGYHFMVVDYPGFGMSGGVPSEQGCYEAAEAAYQYLLTRPDVDHRKIIVAGWSLGGGVAVEVAHRHRGDGTIAGLMTFCTFSSLVDFAKAQYPFLPVGLVLKHRFLSADKLRDLALPLFVGHGRRDRMIPSYHADRVAGAYGGSPGNLTRFASESDHNDFFEVSGDPLREAVAGFLERATR